jgi:hypothetical protein
LETIPVDEFSCHGLDVEPLHSSPSPFVVEGYHLPDPDLKPNDLLPRGVEIRTPTCSSITECLSTLQQLERRMQVALANMGCRAPLCTPDGTARAWFGPDDRRHQAMGVY